MDAHALRTLEFDKILAKLARSTSFSAGRELALALTPSTEYREVVRRQRETAEARRLIAMKCSFSAISGCESRMCARRSSVSRMLTPR